MNFSELFSQERHLGLWIVRNQMTDKKNIDRFVEFASLNGFTDLFIQVRGRGDAYYRSEIAPMADRLNGSDFDPLDYALVMAHANGLKVHVWLNVYLLWSSDDRPKNREHLFWKHPEWCAIDANGIRDIDRSANEFRKNGTEGIYLSPLVPEVRLHLIQIVSELVQKYPIDGVHLDYVRYPKNTYDFNEQARFRFKQKSGVDPILLSISNKSFYAGWDDRVLEQTMDDWSEFRREGINELIRGIRESLTATQKPVKLSTAVKPDPVEAKNHFFQDWETWLKNDWIDFAVPMNYARNADRFETITREIDPSIPKSRIWMGIGVYNQNKFDAMAKTMISLSSGFRNVVFFSYDTFADEPSYFNTLQKAFNIGQ
ncbi:MAG: family 10 glycosylhydrolase [Candidatus Neomarinimicrobiota bacterium]